ncbi:hypothetical protein [Bradyrhizobium sp. HKCCYLRH3061]|uniref:hypothetical protein n=1 Tax=Bradyrhizobium sp. HKCCYLRH3061 TaxID=3420734 RepID=UPI003EBC7EDC
MAALPAIIQRSISIAPSSNSDRCGQWPAQPPASNARMIMETLSSTTRLTWIKFFADAVSEIASLVGQERRS